MSKTELHIGKLRKVELKPDQSLENFYKEKLKEIGITELRKYDNDWEDAFKDEFQEKYFIVNDVIWEAFEHDEKDDSDDIYELKPNPDGTLSFIMKFYNGGTCLSECIEEELEKLN
jgi:hypothetical protein